MAAKKPGRNGVIINTGPGRPKGAKNKFTNLKNSFLEVYQTIGGANGLSEWAEDNRKDFYSMIASDNRRCYRSPPTRLRRISSQVTY